MHSLGHFRMHYRRHFSGALNLRPSSLRKGLAQVGGNNPWLESDGWCRQFPPKRRRKQRGVEWVRSQFEQNYPLLAYLRRDWRVTSRLRVRSGAKNYDCC